MEQDQTCPSCHTVIVETSYFCPNCGKKLKDKPLSTSAIKQVGVYLISLFFPPFGLWPAVKYLKQEDGKSKTIGGVAILLTLLSIMITILIVANIMTSLSKILNGQLNTSRNFGF